MSFLRYCVLVLAFIGLARAHADVGIAFTSQNITQDSNGYYHLELREHGQTLVRLFVDVGVATCGVEWDTDAVHIVEHMSHHFETKMINPFSYTNGNGVEYNMLGPMPEMVGDTVRVAAFTDYGHDVIHIVLD